MKRDVLAIFALSLLMINLAKPLNARESQTGVMLAQNQDEEDFLGEDEEDEFLDEDVEKRIEEERKRREEEERRVREEEARRAEEARRTAIRKQQIKERKSEEERKKELSALREASADTTEYTLDPDSVELVVEMDPNGYGFRSRAHRMTMSGEFDFILRGRGVLHYDYRFFSFLSFGAVLGVDFSDISIYSRFRDHLAKPNAKQFSILGGLSGKWRLTEWYMRSAIFLEPSIVFGHMWQTFVTQKSTHWRLRPGLFFGVETVFNSGLALSTRLGVEFPFDFGSRNPVTEVAEPLLLVGLGFAI